MYPYNRYCDREKFIANEDEIIVYEEEYIPISSEDDFDIAIYLSNNALEIKEIKKYIMYIVEHVCELDNIVLKYDSVKYPNSNDFPYILANIFIDSEDEFKLEYFGCIENTQFFVGFEIVENRFVLKSFGTVKNIPEDWDK